MVDPSFSASRATFALNSAAYRFLFVLLISMVPPPWSYSTPYTTVRFPGTTSSSPAMTDKYVNLKPRHLKGAIQKLSVLSVYTRCTDEKREEKKDGISGS